jgi:serine/threonine protein kinase
METIGKVKHPNLVPLLGYGVCGGKRLLIYEYMENRRDLRYGLRNRVEICLSSTHGLAFLHEGFVPHIIHRDMKSSNIFKKKSNILLDENFELRVDFGLGRIISACKTHDNTDIAGISLQIPYK